MRQFQGKVLRNIKSFVYVTIAKPTRFSAISASEKLSSTCESGCVS